MQNRRPPPANGSGAHSPERQGLVEIAPDSGASDIDLVVRATKQLRQRLVNDLGAQGLTLHECLDSLGQRLPDEEVKRLRFIASVRNRIINDVGVDTLDNRAGFVQAVGQADAAITLRAAAWRAESAASGNARAGAGGRGGKSGAGCFIATAVYPDANAPQLDILRRFRDESLMRTAPGRWAVRLYYRLSPPVAAWLSMRPVCAARVRRVLNAWVRRLERD